MRKDERGSGGAWAVAACFVTFCVAIAVTSVVNHRAEARVQIACAKAGGTWMDASPGIMTPTDMSCVRPRD